jgi:hypothetical protein
MANIQNKHDPRKDTEENCPRKLNRATPCHNSVGIGKMKNVATSIKVDKKGN